MSPLKSLKNSFLEFKKLQSLAVMAMMIALCVVLGIFANIMMFGNAVKITFTFLPIAITGAMYGPVASLFVGVLGDILAMIFMPSGGPINPGITLCAALTGLIYGFFLYKNKITLPRVIIAWALKALISETFLKAFFLYMMYGGDYLGYWLFWRLIQQSILCVPEMLLIFGAGKLIIAAEKSIRKK